VPDETCRHCGGTLKIIASIEDPQVIARILAYLDRSATPALSAHLPRAPPQGDRL
jgi:hypothetical protein